MRTIKVNKTYQVVTHESAEAGEYADSGFLSQGEEVTFTELIVMMQGGSPSCTPVEPSIGVWVEYDKDEDMTTGEVEYYCVHFGDDKNDSWAVRFWERALKYVFNNKKR